MQKKTDSNNCDECGKRKTNISRNYYGHKYCTACYQRNFVNRSCPNCNKLKKLPIFDEKHLCNACLRREPCERCGRTLRPVGRLTQSAMICNSCSLYYRLRKPCDICHTNVQSRYKINNLRVCNQCYRADHKTCDSCTRYRPVYDWIDNKPICKKCSLEEDIICNCCGKLMPAGYGKQCKLCDTKQRVARRIKMGSSGLRPLLAKEWETFTLWLTSNKPTHLVSLKINRYVELFHKLDDLNLSSLNLNNIYHKLGAEYLRRFSYFIQWLSSSCNIVYNGVTKDELSAERLINKYLKTFKTSSKYCTVLQEYYLILNERRLINTGKFRSVRLALTPAVQLLSLCQENNLFPPNQAELNRYLNNTPGQKSAITGFVNYLNNYHSLNLNIEITITKKNRMNISKKDHEKKLLKMRHIKSSNIDDWVNSCLEFFYSKKTLKIKKHKKTIHMAGYRGFIIEINDNNFWIPSSLDTTQLY